MIHTEFSFKLSIPPKMLLYRDLAQIPSTSKGQILEGAEEVLGCTRFQRGSLRLQAYMNSTLPDCHYHSYSLSICIIQVYQQELFLAPQKKLFFLSAIY